MKKISLSLCAIFYLIACFLFLIIPEHIFLVGATFIIALCLTILSFYFHLEEVRNFVKSTFGKNLLSNFTAFFLLFCILAVLNLIVFKRGPIWDLSKRQLNTLSELTVKTVKKIDDKVEMVVFSNKDSKNAILSLLELYKNQNPSLVTKFYDPELRPDMIAQYGVTVSPSIVLTKQDGEELKKVVVTRILELGITNGLIRLEREKDPAICFNYNAKFQDSTDNGFTGLLHVLKQSAYRLNIVDLLKANEIPKSCDVFTILEPTNDFSKEEISKLETYYFDGGRIFAAIMPNFHGEKLPNLKKFFSTNGLNIANDIVMDPVNGLESSKGTAPIISRFDSLNINSDFKERVFFPLVSSISSTLPQEEQGSYHALATSTPESWAEKKMISVIAGDVKKDSEDIEGPIDMAAAITRDGVPAMVAIGNSAFISNKFFSYQSNFKYISNLYHWLSGQGQLTSLHSVVFKEIPLLVSDIEKKVIFYFSIVVLPLAYLVIALVLFQRRKFSA
ncbi:Gldg family protein [Halobacteriovorax sp. ZH4_bin.1]|uniref:Gldg family protein n=1 Tax=unclassified Halobacteriovorax TaxID=2639665 RepID=UPI00371280D7